MDEWNFGSLNNRHLCLRWHVPLFVCEWRDNKWRLSWQRMLSPWRWWKCIKDRWGWAMWARRFQGASHRCYCQTGRMFDGRIAAAGFGVTWFYSHYWGPAYCWCDKVLDDMRAADEWCEGNRGNGNESDKRKAAE